MVSLVGPIILTPLIPGIVAIILAKKANERIAESGGTLAGGGLAKAGRLIGIVDIVAGIVILVVVIIARNA
ncbi:MAG: hypothetical protein M3179_08370 [Actinomycetota bacterium]|nr:hypothetical protein [Actinomycetota bacterium]